MAARQSLSGIANEPFLYQENSAGVSSALGIDVTGIYSISVSGIPGTSPNPTSQIVIDPAGNSTLRSSTKVVLDGFSQITSLGAGYVVSDASGNLTIGSSGGLTWSVETVNGTMAVGHGYIANKAGLLTMTLPAVAAVGSMFEITGINTAVGWRIAQLANQIIHFGTATTTTGVAGYIEATAIRDSVRLVCVVADLEFNVISSVGMAITIA